MSISWEVGEGALDGWWLIGIQASSGLICFFGGAFRARYKNGVGSFTCLLVGLGYCALFCGGFFSSSLVHCVLSVPLFFPGHSQMRYHKRLQKVIEAILL